MSAGAPEGGAIATPPPHHSRSESFTARLAPAADPRPLAFLSALRSEGLDKALGQGETAEALKTQLASIAKDPNPEFFFHSLYVFALDLEDKDRYEAAAFVFSALAQCDPKLFPISEETIGLAQKHWDAARGVGSSGLRSEYIFKHIVSDSASFSTLASMTGASTLGRLSYAAIFRGLKGFELGATLSKGIAGLGSLAIEAPSFTLMNKGIETALGHASSWDRETLRKEFLSSFLFLGMMKLTHASGRLLSEEVLGAKSGLPIDRFTAVSQVLIPEVSTFGGILLAHQAEKGLRLKPRLQNETLFTDALSLWAQFKVSGHLAQSITGEGFNRWLATMEWHSENTPPPTSKLADLFSRSKLVTPEGLEIPSYAMAEMKDVAGGLLKYRPTDVVIQRRTNLRSENAANILNSPQLATLYSMVEALKHPEHKITASTKLAVEYARAGFVDFSKKVFQVAEQIAQGTSSHFVRGRAMSEIGLRKSQAGLGTEAQKDFIAVAQDLQSLSAKFLEGGDIMAGFEAYELAIQLGGDLFSAGKPSQGRRAFKKAELLYKEFHEDTTEGQAHQDAAMQLGTRGFKAEALEYVDRIPTKGGKIVTLGELMRSFEAQDDLLFNKEILPRIKDTTLGNLARMNVALRALSFGSHQDFTNYRLEITDPFLHMQTILRGAQYLFRSDRKLEGISLTILGAEKWHREGKGLTPIYRATIEAMLARCHAYQGSSEYIREQLPKIDAHLQPYLKKPDQKQTIEVLSELVVAMSLDNYSQATMDSWINSLREEERPKAWHKIAVELAQENEVGKSLMSASKVPEERRSATERDIALEFLKIGRSDAAFAIADNIKNAKERFEALLQVFRLRVQDDDDPPTPVNTPPFNSGSNSGPSAGGSSLKSFASPELNANTLGSDLPKKATPLLWEPDLSFFQENPATPWLWESSKKTKGGEPALLFAELPTDGKNPSIPNHGQEILRAGEGNSGEAKPRSDRPPPQEKLFERDVRTWVQNTRGHLVPKLQELSVNLVSTLVQKVYDEMWRVMNFEAGRPLAYRVATGQPLVLRIIASSPRLEDYELKLEDPTSLEPQTAFNEVRWAFDPKKGSLEPIEFANHVSWEAGNRKHNIDISHFFIPYYRQIRFASEGLKSQGLVDHLSPASQVLLKQDPIAAKMAETRVAPGPRKRPDEPSIIGRYFPLILEGARQQVATYADWQKLGEDGTRRLHALVQHAIASLYERAIHRDLPQNRGIETFPFLHIIVGPPDGPMQNRKFELRTPAEAFRKAPGPEDVVLMLLRSPQQFGDGIDYPYLTHHITRTDAQGLPIGADLAFQEYLGLQGPLHLRLDYLHLYPGDTNAWDQWMEENGYAKKSE